MAKPEKQQRCIRRLLLGFFFIITGIGFSADIFVNQPYNFFESWRYQVLWRTLIWAFLVLWYATGLIMLVYGWLEPCKDD
jgi:uncharacterized membrane protein YphA (DoxX/SURF4 family)